MNRFKTALEIQDACNMRAIARELVRVVDEAANDLQSTTPTQYDPAVVLLVNKLESMSHSCAHFAESYRLCEERK